MSDGTLLMGEEDRRRAQQLSLRSVRPPAPVPGYEPDQFLGKGAFGEVWLATDTNTGRRVAIKFYSHREGLDWSPLMREVEKLRFLFSDRHVVQLLEVGWESDPAYFVMEYMEQGSLEEKLKREGPLPVTDAALLFRDIAVGLVHAHNKGILHCDLKPANILLDQDGRPRLADFGQSRLSSDQSPALGTLFYMAPEQADLQAAPDARWDVYALGAVLYQMLTGTPPYRDDKAATDLSRGYRLEERLERYRRLLREAPRPTAHRQVHGVGRGLVDIIERCLAVDPRQRFPDVKSVLEALNAWALRRARRAMLILGVLGPALLLLVMVGFAWKAVDTTVRDSRNAVTVRALESNRFAARFVAEQFALDVERRWRLLELAASDANLRQWMEKIHTLPADAPERGQLQDRLQAWLEKRYETYNNQFKPTTRARSCFIADHDGFQLARSPRDERTINRSWAHRDYFHGLGEDLTLAEANRRHVRPISQPHRSLVFKSKSTKSLMVAFTVPILGSQPADKEPIGILGMTVELGHFAELQGTGNQFAILVDTRKDSERKEPGLIVEHPQMSSDKVNYVPAEVIARAERLQQRKVQQQWKQIRDQAPVPVEAFAGEELLAEDYRGTYQDPLNPDVPWLATIEPVVITRGRDAVVDTHWVVIVQERFDKALEPVNDMRRQLIRMCLAALGLIVLVVLGLWGIVFLVINEAVRSRLTAALRRRAGLATSVSGSGSSRSGAARSDAAQTRTLLFREHTDL